VRRQALKSVLSLGAGAGVALALAAEYIGAKVGTDPRSADFAKMRFGDTRLDILGGFQQYVRLASQLEQGEIVSSSTGRVMTLGPGFGSLSRKDILERFAVGKFAPPPSLVYDFFKGTTYNGQPFEIKQALLQRIIPLVAQDAYDLQQNQGSVPLTAAGYATAAVGIGLQTYSSTQTQDRFTKKMHGLRDTISEAAGTKKLPRELDVQLRRHAQRYGAYKAAGIRTQDPDYQRSALKIDLGLLVHLHVIDNDIRKRWLALSAKMTDDEISTQRRQIGKEYFPTDWLNATAKALDVKVPR
jgi:hypothetical protein